MRRCSQKIGVSILFFLSGYQQVLAQKFNTDAITKFWEVVDQIEKDRPLTDSLWNAYYTLYGNKTYIEKNRDAVQAAEHRKYLEMIFRPSTSDSIAELEKTNQNTSDDILKNLLYIKSNERGLRQYTAQIISGEYLGKCIALAKRNLPSKVNPLPEDLTIYINAMTFDAAVQPPDMYFGLSIIYEFDRFQMGAIAAHEFDHQLRVNKEIASKVTYADSTSFSIVNQINNEGTADMIDKTIALTYRTTLYDAESLLHWLFDDVTHVIAALDSGFLLNAKAGPDRLSYRDFRKITLYSSGHIPGFYMANIIARNGGKQQLISHCDNPFHIFFLYNKLAKQDKEHPPMFSEATMAYLRVLEKRVYAN